MQFLLSYQVDIHIQRSASSQFFANNQNGNTHLSFSLTFLVTGIAADQKVFLGLSLLKISGFMLGGSMRITQKIVVT